MSLTEECAKVTGIPYVMDAYREEAMEILNGNHYAHATNDILTTTKEYSPARK